MSPTCGIAHLIDHTLLDPAATRDQIWKLCDEALQYGFATVCVNGVWVDTAATRLEGSGIGITSVVGFPLGASTSSVKTYEARDALARGATEIDMVMDIGAFRSGDDDRTLRDIAAVRSAVRERAARLKVILETALLTEDEKLRACAMAVSAGADFVKTSTGFGSGGATVADVELLRRAVGPFFGVKASGGIRTIEDAMAMIAAGATRIGTSHGVAIVLGDRSSLP